MNIELSRYRNNKNVKLQLELIDSYKKVLLDNNIFRAAAIVGSFAKGCPDRVSDIDLITFVEDSNGKEAFRKIKEVDLFEKLYSYEGDSEGQFFYQKTIYDNFVSAEVHIAEKSSKFKLKNPYITLFDHDNFLESITEEGETPKHEDFPALSSGGDDMGWALFDLLKWTIKGNKELTKMHLLKIADELRK